MTPLLWTKTATLILLLANSSVFAQDADQPAAVSAAQIAAPVSEPAIAAGAGAASTSEETAIIFGPSVDLPSYPLEPPTDSISHFLHATTIEPVMSVARYAGDWIASGSGAAAFALQDAGRWVASGSNCVASAARNLSEWFVSSSNAAALALQDTGKWVASNASAAGITGDWIASGSSAAVFAARDTREWVSKNAGAAVNSAVDAASATVGGLMIFEGWSVDLVKEIESHLRADGTSEFHRLVNESGFALSDVKVGVGIIPELAVEFRHERDLTPAEIQALQIKIDDHTRTASGVVGYFEALVLRRLLKAGEYSGGMRISEVHVNLFPLPGLDMLFDPFHFEKEQNEMLADAYNLSKADSQSLKVIEDRISKIETVLPALQDKK